MKVFISYRRDDSRDFAGRLADRLATHPKVTRVFFDVESIAPGADFTIALKNNVERVDLVLAVMGPAWHGPKADGSARIQESGDFVRAEIARALASGVDLVPIMVDGAPLPAPQSLPDDIRDLLKRNAVTIRSAYFKPDTNEFAQGVLGAPFEVPRVPLWRRALRALGGAVLFSIIGFGALVAQNAVTGMPFGQYFELDRNQVLAILALVPVLGALVGWTWTGRRS